MKHDGFILKGPPQQDNMNIYRVKKGQSSGTETKTELIIIVSSFNYNKTGACCQWKQRREQSDKQMV